MRIELIISALLLAFPAQARNRTFVASGQISNIYDSSLLPKVGLVSIGDPFRLTISFDPATAVRTTNPANGPGYGQYILPLTYSARIGNFAFDGTSGIAGNYLSFYDNFNACGPTGPASCVVDAAYFSSVGFSSTNGPFPVDPGIGSIFSSFDVQFFDATASVLSSANLSALDRLSSFAGAKLTYDLFNATRSSAVYIDATNASFTLSAVPEPATWSMMILGFASIGLSARNSRRTAGQK